MTNIKYIAIFTLLWSINTSVFATSCTTEQGAYSGGYKDGTEARKDPHENKNMDYYVLKNGGCRGMTQAYSSAKHIAPTQFKPSVDTVYLLCVQGAFAGYDGKKPGNNYKKECEDYPIAKLKDDKHIKHFSKNHVSNSEDEEYASEESTRQELLSQKKLEKEKEQLELKNKAIEEAQEKAKNELLEAHRNELLNLRKNAETLMCNNVPIDGFFVKHGIYRQAFLATYKNEIWVFTENKDGYRRGWPLSACTAANGEIKFVPDPNKTGREQLDEYSRQWTWGPASESNFYDPLWNNLRSNATKYFSE